ncbi:MAG: VOC family protein [Proteobacteria bacterium]|nr:VOC family protein [Pseudomonadota bacterium]
MELAKQHLDIGLYTNRRDEQLAFWQGEVGLEFDHVGKLGRGIHQLRHHMNGSILKINHARGPLAELTPSGYRRLLIAKPGLAAVQSLADPDGNAVDLVPPGHRGIVGIGIEITVSDLAAARHFWTTAMQFQAGADDTVLAGDTVLFLQQNGNVNPTPDSMASLGFRYTTVQIYKCDLEHAGILERGGSEGGPPRTIGTTTRYSFVRDPDGNWIEVSQRAQLTGSLD